jgi:pSer/pThr/pTyr-binding forkhead associated (FHA) protein
VRSGPTAGARYLLDADVTTVGRHPEADIFFDDVTVSRRHAEITRTGDVFELVDQRSLNGSYVNGVGPERTRSSAERAGRAPMASSSTSVRSLRNGTKERSESCPTSGASASGSIR